MKTILAILFFSCSTSFGQEMKEIVKSIYFGGGRYHIDQNQAQQLADLVKSIKNLEYYEINIMSHTDPIGGREFNEYLSRMRSQSAIELLKTLDIPQEKIRFKDFAFDAPAYDNNTWEGRARNRRVDIQFKPIVF
ncbi:OmpA family protein [Lacihabitans soyangensis]|uniref:OmpA family protein n=1 Tax=Lacihabitans soyangensis TaxID=869394 RepID=A0AAE3KTX9_9BACT|nr:OmpA family protein [Lacihabitans soyangensis]MCP9764513.1 OmpA family protein [Lacihabitans soyangensis]